MLRMKTSLSIITLCLMGQTNAKTSLTLGYFELPPFAYTENGKAKGVAIDYLTNLFTDSQDYSVRFKNYPFQRMLVEIQKSRLDGAVLLGKNPARELIFSYPSAPYISDRPAIVFKKGNSPIKIMKVEDLKDYDIGIPEKAYISPFISTNKDSLRLKYIPSGVDHLEPMMLSLAMSRGIQGLYLPTLSTLVSTAKKLNILDKLSFLQTPEKADKFYTVFSKKIDKKVIEFYNSKNLKFISDTKLREIISK